LRPPTITWKVTRLDGTPVRLPPPSDPVNVAPITDDDVVDLAPGERLELFPDGPDLPAQAGAFRVRIVYEYVPSATVRSADGYPHSPRALARLARSSPCRIESNSLVR
jgi:hypothetical protein